MSVSVLNSHNPSFLFQPASRTGATSFSARMSRPPHLKRPWDQDTNPPRSSHSQQYPESQQSITEYARSTNTMIAHPHMSGPHHAPGLSRHSSQHGHGYGETYMETVSPHELHHKRSRIESDQSGSLQSPPAEYPHSRSGPTQPSHVHTQMPSYTAGSHDRRFGTSSSSTSPQSTQYSGRGPTSGPAPVFPSPSSVTSSTGTSHMPSAHLPLSSALLSPPASTNSHLQSLQHELSSKSQAYSSLAGEHERILAAYSRLQQRLATIDRKSKATDGELMILQEERITLLERIESLEKEVDEVRAAKEEEINQRNREGEQWRRILSLSETVQRRHTGETESWKIEKENLLRKVEGLEGELRRARLSTGSVNSADIHESAEVLGSSVSSDPDQVVSLRSELASLRAQNDQSRRQLLDYRTRMGELKELLSKADGLAILGGDTS